MNPLALVKGLKRAFDDYVRVTGIAQLVGGQAQLTSGLRLMRMEMDVIAIERLKAKERGVSMAEASHDYDNYPAFAQFHTALEDVLHWSMPAVLVKWSKRLLQPNSGIERPALALVQWIIRGARSAPDERVRALCEVMLFEFTRLGLTFEAELAESDVFLWATGDLARSVIAEDEVARWLAEPQLDAAAVFDLTLTSAMLSQVSHAHDVIQSVGQVALAVREQVEIEAKMTRYFNELDAADALLLRNQHARGLDEQPLSLAMLRSRHLAVLGELSEDAMSQRLHRVNERLATGGLKRAKRRTPALIDLVREAANS